MKQKRKNYDPGKNDSQLSFTQNIVAYIISYFVNISQVALIHTDVKNQEKVYDIPQLKGRFC